MDFFDRVVDGDAAVREGLANRDQHIAGEHHVTQHVGDRLGVNEPGRVAASDESGPLAGVDPNER